MTEVYRDKNGDLYLYHKDDDLYCGYHGGMYRKEDLLNLEKVHLQPPEYGKRAKVWDSTIELSEVKYIIKVYKSGACDAIGNIENYENGTHASLHYNNYRLLPDNSDIQPALDLIAKMTPEQKARLKDSL